MKRLIKRIKAYRFCKQLGIHHPWRASGDKNFIQFN